MQKLIGIWIDQERAKIIALVGSEVKITYIDSGAGGHFRMSGGTRSKVAYGPMSIADERKIDRRRKHKLHKYYSEVVKQLSDADKIFIMGPGEAKVELKRHLGATHLLAGKITAVEPVDKMSEKQIIAKVKSCYGIKK